MLKNKEAAIAAIRTCKTPVALEDELTRYEISKPEEIICCLNECMYSPEVFYSANPNTPEDEAEFTKQVFLTGAWRLNEFYERMGIPRKEAGVHA